jgi:GxxExxY protein
VAETSEEMQQEGGKKGRYEKGFRDCSERVIGACIEVHRHLGPGLLESVYEHCLCRELSECGLRYERQKALPLSYKGLVLEGAYRLDLVVEAQLLVEIKAVERLLPVHVAQAVSYLRLSGLGSALLVNFHVAALKLGLRRLTNKQNPSPIFPSSRLPVRPT